MEKKKWRRSTSKEAASAAAGADASGAAAGASVAAGAAAAGASGAAAGVSSAMLDLFYVHKISENDWIGDDLCRIPTGGITTKDDSASSPSGSAHPKK